MLDCKLRKVINSANSARIEENEIHNCMIQLHIKCKKLFSDFITFCLRLLLKQRRAASKD